MDEETEPRLTAFDGSEFIITKRRWFHIIERHAELKNMMNNVREAASIPDEVFSDKRGTLHLLKRTRSGQFDFLVLIARREGPRTYLITAYPTRLKRKERRYRKFRKLPLS